MASATNSEVEVPEIMAHLERDRRGYPIPATVLRDANGEPHFAVNDVRLNDKFLAERLCGVCGTELKRTMWFVGGPLSAAHPQGAFYDLPLHDECAHYSLKVCPYLALPKYNHIGLKNPKLATMPTTGVAGVADHSPSTKRPEIHGALCVTGFDVHPSGHPLMPPTLKPHRPALTLEFWRHGELISYEDAAFFMKAEL